MRSLSALVVVLLLALSAHASFAQAGLQKIPLRYTDPRYMVEVIGQPLPEGIQSLAANELENALLVVGTPDAVAGLRQALAFLDRQPTQVRVEADVFSLETSASVEAVLAGVGKPQPQGVYTGESAEKVAAVLRQQAEGKRARTVISPRVTTVTGHMGAVQSQPSGEGTGYAVQVTPEVHGKMIRAMVLAFEATRTGITYSGRLLNEIVDVPDGGRVAFWMSPTKDAPTNLVIVLRLAVIAPESLAPAALGR